MSEWKKATLQDVCSVITDGAHNSPKEVVGGYPMASVKDMTRHGIDLSAVKRISFDDFERLKKQGCMPLPGDVLIAKDGNSALDTVCIHKLQEEIVLLSSIAILRPNQEVCSGFLRYYLDAPQIRRMLKEGFRSGSAIPRVVLKDFRRAPIVYPPLREQQAIASILGTLDDKIELNRRRNRTLEAMARAIFQSWFVDFDPVKAKAAGRTPPGLSPELAALFPDRFEDSPLGPIPAGWRVTSLADEITANKGLSYKGDYLAEPGEGLPMHNLNSVYEGGGYKHEGLKWYTGEYRPAHVLKPGDVIVTNTEQGFDYLLIGYAAIVPKRYGDKGLFSHHIYRIQAKDTSYLPTWFIYLLLRTPVFHELVAGHSNGTTVNMLPLDGLQKPRFVLPPEQLVRNFGKMFEPTQQQLEVMHDENVTLAALRDALLPKLISGELRVPDAERIVGRSL
jgi:type I restriction enzyme S subunit